ncbi:MAG TPA: ATP-binding protein [Steroidobacteraceae bacterium]
MTTPAAARGKWSIEQKTLAGLAAAGVLLLFIVASTYLTMQGFVHSSQRVTDSLGAIAVHERLYSAFSDVLASQRAYIITGSQAYLTERAAAVDRLRNQLHLLHEQTTTGLSGAPDMKALEVAIEEDIQAQRPTIAAAATNPEVLREPRLWADRQARVTRIRALLDKLRVAEEAALARHREVDRQSAQRLYLLMAFATVAFLCAIGGFIWRIRQDLRDRRDFQNRLQQSNQFLESLLENIPTMIFAKDAQDLRFVRLNRAGEQLLGYARADLIGKSDRDFFPPGQADTSIAKDREVMAQGDIVDIPEEEIDTRDGERRILHTRKVPLRHANGTPILLLGISMDVTEQKAAERRIVALNTELQRHTKLLEASNAELESFCYSVSHDLRAPLRAINGYAKMLEQDFGDRFDESAQRYVKTICSASVRMARLIDDLLEFARIGQQALEREVVDMQIAARTALSEALGGREGIRPEVSIAALPPIRGDRRMLHLVWLNLLDNAVKYTSAIESAHIRIDAEFANGEVVYSVSDNGIGFDMEYYEKLFGVFERLHAHSEYPGTGVGLAITQRIVIRHGGRIWAMSQPGRGATFFFALPAGDGPRIAG